MIKDLLSEGVLFAAVALVTMPLVARRFSQAFRPVELTRYNSATMSTGMALLLTALVVCATPVVTSLLGSGFTDRHFFPGDTAIGWISAGLALAIVTTAAIGGRRSRAVQRKLAVEPSIGVHIPRPGYELVVLPTQIPMAYAIGGRHPQVVLTTGLVGELTVAELVSVVEHEEAHLKLSHRRHLAVIAMLDPIAAWVPPIRRLLEVTRMALERAADSATTDHAATRSALLRLSGVSTAPGIAAFTAGDVVERLDALSVPALSPDTSIRAMLYLTAISLGAVSIAALWLFWF